MNVKNKNNYVVLKYSNSNSKYYICNGLLKLNLKHCIHYINLHK